MRVGPWAGSPAVTRQDRRSCCLWCFSHSCSHGFCLLFLKKTPEKYQTPGKYQSYLLLPGDKIKLKFVTTCQIFRCIFYIGASERPFLLKSFYSHWFSGYHQRELLLLLLKATCSICRAGWQEGSREKHTSLPGILGVPSSVTLPSPTQ